jgi:iron(III) transport system substrate-binding protein
MHRNRSKGSSGRCSNLSRPCAAALVIAGVLASPAAQAQTASKAPPDAWKSVVAAAQKEGRVVLYSAVMPQIQERLKADFEKTYPGIVIEATRYPSGVMLAKLEQERAAGVDGADVHIFAETGWTEARTLEGTVKAPAGPAAAGWPANYLLRGGAPILGVEPAVIVWNTNIVKTPLTGYKDLLAPEHKGRIGLLDMTATAMAAAYDWMEKGQGPNFFPGLVAQQTRLYGTVTAGAQSVAAGELGIAGYLNIGVVVPLIRKGAPLGMVVPNPSFGVQYTGGALGWGRRPNAAQVLMDYVMSRRGQAVWHGEGESASPLPNIAGSLDIRTINPYNAAPYTPDVVNAARSRWNAMFKK